MTLRDRIKKLCAENNISLNKIEKELGFASGYLSKLDKSTPNSIYIQRIAERFGVSVDYLLTGEEDGINDYLYSELNYGDIMVKEGEDNYGDMVKERKVYRKPSGPRRVEDIIAHTKALLEQDGLMFDGNPASEDSIESIISAMQIGLEMAKKKNKEKYTPNKYKKD